MKWNKLLLALVVITVARAGDCVPNTLTTLSYITGHPVKNELWMKELFKDSDTEHNNNPDLPEAVRVWKHLMPGFDLAQVSLEDPLLIGTNTPYVWIGKVDPKVQDTTQKDSSAHATIVYFYASCVEIVNTVDVHDIQGHAEFDFYVERVPYKEFLDRTLILYQVRGPDNLSYIHWISLLGH